MEESDSDIEAIEDVAVEESKNISGSEDDKEVIEDPKKDMEFDNTELIYTYYKEYGKQKGFGVCKKSRSKTDGVVTHVTIACHRSRKSQQTAKNILRPNTITRTDCKARVCARLCADNKWRLTTVERNHNHLCSPNKSRRFRCNRVVKAHTKRQLFLRDRNGMSIRDNIRTSVAEEGGYDEATFINKDARNMIAKERERRLMLDGGDAAALLNHFMKMQKVDKDFFYLIDLDEDKRIRNIFWADGRSRAAYKEFNDVITFDTTYLTNRYDMPFAPFVGVNHHGHSTLFGCGLISHENTESFEWLFRSWLTCMNENAPDAIITDQAQAIRNAIESVFPITRHRLCLWHIMKKIPDKLSGYEYYKPIKTTLKNVVYDSLTIEEFEFNWKSMIVKFGLEKNSWLKGLYEEKCRWVPCFVKDPFWAGMSTTQRSESINAFFDGYVNAKTSFKQFVEQYDNALRSKVEKEKDADFHSFNSKVQTITQYPMEKQFQSIYTISKFREFQHQLQGFMYCVPTLLESRGGVQLYSVSEIIFFGKDGENQRTVSFNVALIREETNGDFDVKCVCRLFEFRGILCKHIIAVLVTNFIYANIPDKYILRRWRTDIVRHYTKIRVTYNDWGDSEEGRQYDKMIKAFYDVADIAYGFEEKCNIVVERLADLKKEIDGICGNTPLVLAQKFSDSNKGKSIGSQEIFSPIPIRCKGRPPTKRKTSKVDQIVAKKRTNGKHLSSSRGEKVNKGDATYIANHDFVSGTQESICNQTIGVNELGVVSGGSYMDLLQSVSHGSVENEG